MVCMLESVVVTVTVTLCCFAVKLNLAKDLLSKLHSSKDAHGTEAVESEAAWFLRIGKP